MKHPTKFPFPDKSFRLGSASNQRTFQRNSAQGGSTLVEFLIYIAIFSGIAVSLVLYIINISQVRTKNDVVQEVQANARFSLNLISQKLRAADSVNTGSSTFGTHPGVLSLDMDGTTTLIDLESSNQQIQITAGSGSAIPITTGNVKVTNLVFTDLTSTSSHENIRIQLTIEYDNTEDVFYQHSQSWQTSVSIRQ